MRHILPEVVDRILSSPTPSVLLDRMDEELETVGVASFILLRFSYSGDPLDKWIVGARDAAEYLDKYVYRDDPSASPVVQHAKTVVEPFFWHDVAGDESLRMARESRFQKGLSSRCQGREAALALDGWAHQAKGVPS